MRRSALLPASLIVVAAGLAVFTSGGGTAQAQVTDSAGTSDTNGAVSAPSGDLTTNTSQVEKTGVGSGRENYYVPETKGLPKVDNPGQYLYVQGCSTCHGLDGAGNGIPRENKNSIPSLQGVGAADVDFWVGTGRMPISAPMKQAPRKTPVYSQEQIDAIAQYVTTNFGGGPPVPTVDLEAGDIVQGNLLYASNCAQCHNSAGSGGSLGRDYNAPRLTQATPTQIAEAIRIGPGAMPLFGENTFDQQQLNSLVKYVDEFKYEDARGGLKLGSTGPVPEAYFAWFIGLGAMLGLIRWIGTRV